MANPNNALGTNGAYGGRTSVNAFNDVLGAFNSRGILSGWGCVPSSGLTVEIGGNGSVRDVALAEDNVGNKTTVNNISQAPIPVVMPAAPANNSRVDSIVAYIESSPSTNAETDNYSAVNLLVVSGNTGTTPSAPSENEIRTAITADGASGSTAYYVVLANITIPAGTTDIDATMISPGPSAVGQSGHFEFGNVVVQWGLASNQWQTVNLPVAMPDTSYSITLTPLIPEQGNYFWWAHLHTQDPGSFTYRAGYKSITTADGGYGDDVFVKWIAVGIK